jgi:hypothetical protein
MKNKKQGSPELIKRKAGRPRLAEDEKQSVDFHFQIKPSEMQQIKDIAKAKNSSYSALIKETLRKHLIEPNLHLLNGSDHSKKSTLVKYAKDIAPLPVKKT